MHCRTLLLLSATLLAAGCGAPPSPSPYVDEQDREIKALDASEVAGLLAGEGLGYAMAAELNGLPGPRHVLDAAGEIGLDAEQRARIEEIFASMNAEAVELGAELVERERDLDRLFADGGATPEAVEAATTAIARVQGALRNVHLQAHLATTPLLSPEQRHRYHRVRGYDVTGDGPDDAGHEHTGH